MPAGQPTRYDPAFCDRIIEMGKYGASKAEMACELGICRKTFLNYENAHPEFLHAVNQAVEYSQAWWERNGRTATFGGVEGFNATSFIFNMKNRFPGDWKDKRETELSGTVELFDKRQIDAVAAAILNETTESD